MSCPCSRTGERRTSDYERPFPWMQFAECQVGCAGHEVSEQIVHVELGVTAVVRRICRNRLQRQVTQCYRSKAIR